jgi:hypothetical protein
MEEDPNVQELSAEQLSRAKREEQLAEVAEEDEEVAQHERRADKARYLREKLEERRESERK